MIEPAIMIMDDIQHRNVPVDHNKHNSLVKWIPAAPSVVGYMYRPLNSLSNFFHEVQ